MARYVDGFVLPVPKRKLPAYRRMAQKAGKVWRDHGALEFRECVADDVKVGKWTSFPRSVKLKRGETVFFYTQNAQPLLQALAAHSHLRTLHRPANLEDLFLKLTGRQIRE